VILRICSYDSVTYGMRKSLCKIMLDMYQGALANFELANIISNLMLRISHCLDNRLRDCDEVVSLTHRPLSTP
jgi:hypothetical protein